MLVVIDYNVGNVKSVCNAFDLYPASTDTERSDGPASAMEYELLHIPWVG